MEVIFADLAAEKMNVIRTSLIYVSQFTDTSTFLQDGTDVWKDAVTMNAMLKDTCVKSLINIISLVKLESVNLIVKKENALMKKIIISRNEEIKRYMKLTCLRGLVLGISRYVGYLIFMPIVLI